MASMRHKGMNMVLWILMALLMFGLAGFGVENFGGSANTVATVDGRDISANDYARTLDQQMKAFSAQIGKPVTVAEVQSMGMDRVVRSQLVSRALLDEEAGRIGLSIGDEAVREQILAIPAFKGLDGSFDRTAYGDLLRRNGFSEADFEQSLREDAARGLIQSAVGTGVGAPAAAIDTIVNYLAETRATRHLTLTEATLPEAIPTPDDAALRVYYDAHIADFTRPEAKRISYAWATPTMLAPTAPVDEAALRAAYDSRIEEYVQPERRLVERLAFGSDEEATATKARLDAGQITFDGLLAERRLTLGDIDLGDVSKAELGAAGDAVFALTAPGVVGPLPSDFGPALFRMNGILAAQETSFEEARPQLQEELGMEAARRELSGEASAIDDLLAGGASLEELAKDTSLELGQIDWHAGLEDDVAAYPEFREAATRVKAGDFPELITLNDGGLLVMQLAEIVPPAPRPFEEVRDAVADAWHAEELTTRLKAQGDALLARVTAGEDITALGVDVETSEALRRDSQIGTLPADFVTQAFAMNPGDARLVPGEGSLLLVRLDAVNPAQADNPDVQQLRAVFSQQMSQSLGQDMLEYFGASLQRNAKITFNEGTITAVHSQMQ